jgi:DNA-binding HxlR family transcriptional regulator
LHELLGKKGTKGILLALEKSPKKFNELLDSLQPPRISRRTLARRLRELENFGLIERELPKKPPGVLYVLTSDGKQKIKLIKELEK